MALWFLRGLRKGIVTTRYPAELDAWTRTLPTPPTFRSELLTSELADRLVRICPSRALARDGDQLTVDLGACSGCQRCVEEGGGVVEASGVFELATAQRERLIKRVAIRGGS
jgi:hypothetical protein